MHWSVADAVALIMEPRNPAEVALPVPVLGDLRRRMAQEAGQEAAARVFRSAGADYGERLATALVPPDGPAASASRTASDFWARLGKHLRAAGWGTLQHERPHAAVGMLTSADWSESLASLDESHAASCVFSAGMLEGLLTRVAGRSVAVLEVECRGRQNGRCAFAFGSERAIRLLDGALTREGDLARALASLEP